MHITQEWLNKQSYETLANIVEMLYCTHTIEIPEWSEMTADKIKDRCDEWGVEQGENMYHSRNRLRKASQEHEEDEEDEDDEDEDDEDEEDEVEEHEEHEEDEDEEHEEEMEDTEVKVVG
mgnify:CR=1 FL=1|tara:strand:+ start:734 stop:1093 length:360 start_codon:yes stop_codon:yes gene_type:complete